MLTDLLPILLLNGLLVLLPFVLQFISVYYEDVKYYSEVQNRVLSRYFTFQVQGRRFEMSDGDRNSDDKTQRLKMNRQTSRRHMYHTRRVQKTLPMKLPWCYAQMSSNKAPRIHIREGGWSDYRISISSSEFGSHGSSR